MGGAHTLSIGPRTPRMLHEPGGRNVPIFAGLVGASHVDLAAPA